MVPDTYLAPMEGLTGFVFRQVYHEMFELTAPPGAALSKYYLPFMAPQMDGSVKTRDKKEYAPEHNRGIQAVPQILTNHAEAFVIAAKRMHALGYEEVNLNLGCPYPTVVSKGKGSGFLGYPDRLENFLDEVFREEDLPKISIKTRLSQAEDPDANDRLFALYDRYPVCELIVHPRRQKDFYQGKPDRVAFARIAGHTRLTLCYNGNLYTPQDIRAFADAFPNVPAVMLGRGLVRNPALLRVLHGGEPMSVGEFRAFHDRLYRIYQEVLSGPGAVLGHMKELWMYWETGLVESPKAMKSLYKARKCVEYEAAVSQAFSEIRLLPPDQQPRATAKLIL